MKSSAQARLEAKTIQLFTAAMARGMVTSPKLPAEIADAPLKAKAFSRVLCVAISNVQPLVREITNRTDAVLNVLYGQEPNGRVNAGYDRYHAVWNAG